MKNNLIELALVFVGLFILIFIGIPVFIIYSIQYYFKGRLAAYWHQVAIAYDQAGASLFGWNNDVTVSERLGLEIMHGRANWFIKLMCKFLDLFEVNHCLLQAKKYYKELNEQESPFKTV